MQSASRFQAVRNHIRRVGHHNAQLCAEYRPFNGVIDIETLVLCYVDSRGGKGERSRE